jgi:hypothetical protein
MQNGCSLTGKFSVLVLVEFGFCSKSRVNRVNGSIVSGEATLRFAFFRAQRALEDMKNQWIRHYGQGRRA